MHAGLSELCIKSVITNVCALIFSHYWSDASDGQTKTEENDGGQEKEGPY